MTFLKDRTKADIPETSELVGYEVDIAHKGSSLFPYRASLTYIKPRTTYIKPRTEASYPSRHSVARRSNLLTQKSALRWARRKARANIRENINKKAKEKKKKEKAEALAKRQYTKKMTL